MILNQPTPPCIRPMTHGDLERVLEWRNHPEVRRYMFTGREIPLAEHTRWFELAKQDSSRHLLIFEQLGTPLGFVSFHANAPGSIAEWGFYTAPDAAKGTGRQLGAAALRYAFEIAGFHKVCGQAIAFNHPSIRFHLNQGFTQEGILRDQHYDGSQYHDVVCFGLLANEWLANN